MDSGSLGEQEIAADVMHHFQSLFSKDDHQVQLQHLNCIQPMISHEENAEMCFIPEEEEIQKTIFEMNLDSALGSDGFGGAFYQFW